MVGQPDNPVLRVCRTCHESKPLTAEFWSPQKGYRDGFVPHCRTCVNARAKAYKAEQRRARGALERRRPRFVHGVEEWECKTAGCGWHARSEFYVNQNGTPRPLCKRCHCRASVEDQRTNEARRRITENKQRRWRESDPAGWTAKERRLAERAERHARGVRLCPGCGAEWPFAEFQPTAKKPTGSRARCHECRNEQAVEYARRARASNPDRARGHAYARRARVRGAPVSDLTPDEWKRIRAAYGDRCGFCGRACRTSGPPGRDRLTQEHDVPVSRGGNHSASNVYPACLSCNGAKQDRTADEWAAAGGYRLDRGPHPFTQLPLAMALPKRVKPRKPFPIPDGWNRLALACAECSTSNEPLCDVCRRRVQRWQAGSKVRKRAPRFDADGIELHLCGDPECAVGWQRADGFYRSTRGGLRSRCKACMARRSAERFRSAASV